jgi:hypothetical protein
MDIFMLGLFKSDEEKEIQAVVDEFFKRFAQVGESLDDDLSTYQKILMTEEDELIGGFNFAFYHVQIFRVLAIVDLKTSNTYSLNFGKIIGKKMSSTKVVGMGGFQDLTNFINPRNRLTLGNIGVKEAIANWIVNKVLDVKNPSETQVKAVLKYILQVNSYVDETLESINPKFSLSRIEIAALNS